MALSVEWADDISPVRVGEGGVAVGEDVRRWMAAVTIRMVMGGRGG